MRLRHTDYFTKLVSSKARTQTLATAASSAHALEHYMMLYDETPLQTASKQNCSDDFIFQRLCIIKG